MTTYCSLFTEKNTYLHNHLLDLHVWSQLTTVRTQQLHRNMCFWKWKVVKCEIAARLTIQIGEMNFFKEIRTRKGVRIPYRLPTKMTIQRQLPRAWRNILNRHTWRTALEKIFLTSREISRHSLWKWNTCSWYIYAAHRRITRTASRNGPLVRRLRIRATRTPKNCLTIPRRLKPYHEGLVLYLFHYIVSNRNNRLPSPQSFITLVPACICVCFAFTYTAFPIELRL